jgi:S-adenosylmethionine:diacylglycerol 3-amino-3-carboxypropyl transferase
MRKQIKMYTEYSRILICYYQSIQCDPFVPIPLLGAIKSVSHRFVGLTSVNPTKLINSSNLYAHESKDFKLNVADMEIWKIINWICSYI